MPKKRIDFKSQTVVYLKPIGLVLDFADLSGCELEVPKPITPVQRRNKGGTNLNNSG
jgi:hypothetical protein